MKKRFFLSTAIIALAVSITACGGTKQTGNNTTPTIEAETTTAPTVTEEPTATATSTEAPTETPVEPTEAPTEPPEITEAPVIDVPEDPNFAKIKEMTVITKEDYNSGDYYNMFYQYADYLAIIETMDTTRYVVTAVDSLDPIFRTELTTAERQAATEEFFSASGMFDTYHIERTNKFGKTNQIGLLAKPTGEFYTMTLTDLVTGETVVWGIKIHMECIEEFEDLGTLGAQAVDEYGIVGLLDTIQREFGYKYYAPEYHNYQGQNDWPLN